MRAKKKLKIPATLAVAVITIGGVSCGDDGSDTKPDGGTLADASSPSDSGPRDAGMPDYGPHV